MKKIWLYVLMICFSMISLAGVGAKDLITAGISPEMLQKNSGNILKAASFSRVISPKLGTPLAGYGRINQEALRLDDDLYVNALYLEDLNGGKLLIASFDLIGLDEIEIREMKNKAAEILQCKPCQVLLSCTHTHGGPNARRTNVASNADGVLFNAEYVEKLKAVFEQEVRKLAAAPRTVCVAYFYSVPVSGNRNRRYTSPGNAASFIPHRRELRAGLRGFADEEFGLIYLRDIGRKKMFYVIGNYSAHPLAGHSVGTGALRISSDFPGFFRRYLQQEAGCNAMFITGASGDLIPLEDEQGTAAMRDLGEKLGKAAVAAVIDIHRNGPCFKLDGRLGASELPFEIDWRQGRKGNPSRLSEIYVNADKCRGIIQCVAIGDVALVGVPGELCCELGMEIKWHSPFRRTFIAYNSTAYLSYICPANFLVAGGYEANRHPLVRKGGLMLVNTAVDGLFALHDQMFPEMGNFYPENVPSTPSLNWPEKPVYRIKE